MIYKKNIYLFGSDEVDAINDNSDKDDDLVETNEEEQNIENKNQDFNNDLNKNKINSNSSTFKHSKDSNYKFNKNFKNQNNNKFKFINNQKFYNNKNQDNNFKQNNNKEIINTKIQNNLLEEEKIDFEINKNLIFDNLSKNEKDKTYIFALGGLEEIGKNMYVIEHNEEIIVVDIGIKFASHNMLGINGIIPNFDYFKDNNKKITKLIITHGHEDHIGGVPFAIRDIQIETILSPLLAAELIKRKISEFKEINNIPEIEIFSDESVIKTKYFEIDFFRVCHSIPDCFGLCIKTPNGNVMSAGDYRFDFGKYNDDTDIHKIVEMSNRGIDIFLAESTNSDQVGFSETEDNIIENIESIMRATKGRIFVATFASNLGRIERVIEKGINLNRKICIMGRSMEANIKTSKKVGYIKLNDSDFISSKEIATTPDENVLVILTGSQGEEMAALNLMSEGKYLKVNLKPSDTILLSSNPIPGNFKSVETLVNKLFKLGVNVIQHSPLFKIHASGHATKQEQQMMIKLIKPKYLFPIHGESKMLRSMKNNAINIGFNPENIIIGVNGQKIELHNHEAKLTNYCVDTTPVLIDKKIPSKHTYKLIEDRKVISEEGVFLALICLDKEKRQLYKNPMLTTRGCFYAKNSSALISKISYSIKEELETMMKNKNEFSNSDIEEIIKKNIHMYIWKNKKKHPVVLTTIFNK